MKQASCLFLVCLAVLGALSNGLLVNCSIATPSSLETVGAIEYAHVPGVKHHHSAGSHSCDETPAPKSDCEHEVSSCVDKQISSELVRQLDSLSITSLVLVPTTAYCLPDCDQIYNLNPCDLVSPIFALAERPELKPDALSVHIPSTVILI